MGDETNADSEITLFGTARAVHDGDAIDISLRLTTAQARRIERQVPEATTIQEACRMLIEEQLRHRERQMGPDDYRQAFHDALEPIKHRLDDMGCGG